MKKFSLVYTKIYVIFTPISLFLAVLVNRRVTEDLNLFRLFLGGLIISVLGAFSYQVFKKTIGNGAWNVILSYLVAFPIPFVLRWMYETYLFKRPLAIYFMGFIYAVLYSMVVIYAKIRNKKDEQKLNDLLNQKDHQENGE